MRHLCFLFLGIAPQLLLAAEQPLKLPLAPGELNQYMDGGDARCPGCGVVTNVRQVASQVQTGVPRDEVNPPRIGDAGPGEEVETVTILGSGSQSRKARKQAAKPPEQPWQVTVRYDDGSYAAFGQDDQPTVSVGDRIQVISGRVERR